MCVLVQEAVEQLIIHQVYILRSIYIKSLSLSLSRARSLTLSLALSLSLSL
jgi:hypothetical protein